MSKLAEFRALEQQLATQLAELEALKNDDGLKKINGVRGKASLPDVEIRQGPARHHCHP